MTTRAFDILSGLTDDQLLRVARDLSYPKWSTMAVLRLAGLPTLDACFVPPYHRLTDVDAAVREFSETRALSRVLVRSDGGLEKRTYYRGGNTYDLARAADEARDLVSSGRAVILTEPTNRFINQLSVNLMLDRSARTLSIEILGPGFDCSDLNRGGIPPQVAISVRVGTWAAFARIAQGDVTFTVDLTQSGEEARRRARLQGIADEILPAADPAIHVASTCEAERWLRRQGYTCLWTPWTPDLSLRRVRRFYEDALMLGLAYGTVSSWSTLVCSGSDLGDGRYIYWDIVNAERKYGQTWTGLRVSSMRQFR